jgi:hypothetical protein
MMDVKLHESCYYTDTDSAFGDDLGMFKDELNGLVIEEAEFIGVKQYGYWYKNKEGNRVERSIFAGVTRNSLSFKEIKSLQNGETLTIKPTDRFFKSLLNLTISIKSLDAEIKKNNPKLLHDNFYYPPIINNDVRDVVKENILLKVGRSLNKHLNNRIKRLKMKIKQKINT